MPLSGSLKRLVSLLTRTKTGEGQFWQGIVTRSISLFTRKYGGVAQIFSGILSVSADLPIRATWQAFTGSILHSIGKFTGGILRASGAVTRVLNNITRTYAGSFRLSGITTRLISLLTRSSDGSFRLSGTYSYVKHLLSEYSRTATGALTLSKVLSSLSVRLYTATGISQFTTALTRTFDITKQASGALCWFAELTGFVGEGSTSRKGRLGFLGVVVTRFVQYSRQISALALGTGIVTYRLELFRATAGDLNWGQGQFDIEGYKERLYFGPPNP